MEAYDESKKRLRQHRSDHFSRVGTSLDKFVYWTSLLILGAFNIVAVFMLIPLLVFFTSGIVYFFVVIFGFVFGLLFYLLLRGIEHLEPRHHIIAGFFIPVVAVLDFLLILFVADEVSALLLKPLDFNASIAMIAFVSAFIVPYLFSMSMRMRRTHEKKA